MVIFNSYVKLPEGKYVEGGPEREVLEVVWFIPVRIFKCSYRIFKWESYMILGYFLVLILQNFKI